MSSDINHLKTKTMTMTIEQKKGLLKRLKLLMATYCGNKPMLDELQKCLSHLKEGNMEVFKAVEFYEQGVIEILDNQHLENVGMKIDDLVFETEVYHKKFSQHIIKDALEKENYELLQILKQNGVKIN